MDELLQRHRTFTLSVAVGAFVFLLAVLLRGCAFYRNDLGVANATAQRLSRELTASPVPDDRYLKALDGVVKGSGDRVAELAREVGFVERGEALWERCISDTLKVIGQDRPEVRREILERARGLPSAAFSLLLGRVRTVLMQRAAEADVEIAVPELGFEMVQESNFARSLAALSAVARILDRAIALGVVKAEQIGVGGSARDSGGTADDPFLTSQIVRFRFKGDPAALAELVKSVNDRDASGRRLVLEELLALGRSTSVRAGEAGNVEFSVRVILVNLEAKEEEAP